MLYTSVTSIERKRGQDMNPRHFSVYKSGLEVEAAKIKTEPPGRPEEPGDYRVKEAKWGRGRPTGPRAAHGSGEIRTAGLSNIEDSDLVGDH